MEKPKLDLIKKSDIVKGENVMEDFEYTFLDFKQVFNRIEWLKSRLDYESEESRNAYSNNRNVDLGIAKRIVDEAFSELSTSQSEGTELPLNPIPSQIDNQNNGSGTKPLNEGI